MSLEGTADHETRPDVGDPWDQPVACQVMPALSQVPSVLGRLRGAPPGFGIDEGIRRGHVISMVLEVSVRQVSGQGHSGPKGRGASGLVSRPIFPALRPEHPAHFLPLLLFGGGIRFDKRIFLDIQI